MQILQIIVVSLFFVASLSLIFLILIQSGKGGGMGIMGGGGSNTAFGSSTVDVVEKASWWGIGAFLVLAITAAVIFSDAGPQLPEVSPLESEEEIPLSGDTLTEPVSPEAAPAAVPAGNQAPSQAPAPANQ